MSENNSNQTTQYLSFKLDKESFALDISKVREILDLSKITKVPRMPEFMLGVINLRGKVVPVVDMRLKLGLPKGEQTVNTCIIIVENTIDSETTTLGALVDSVQEVFDMDQTQVEPPPRLGTRLNTEFLDGMGKIGEDFVLILDFTKIFSVEELLGVGNMNSGDAPVEEEPEAVEA